MSSYLKKGAIGLGLIVGLKLLPVTYNVQVGELYRDSLNDKYTTFILDYVADFTDTVVINIDSHGGVVLTGLDIINSILESDANTIAKVQSGAFSGGAFIAMAADKLETAPYSSILFHKARYYDNFGRAIIVDNLIVDKYFDEKVKQYLTDEEVQLYLDGKDVELLTSDLIKRIEDPNIVINLNKQAVEDKKSKEEVENE